MVDFAGFRIALEAEQLTTEGFVRGDIKSTVIDGGLQHLVYAWVPIYTLCPRTESLLPQLLHHVGRLVGVRRHESNVHACIAELVQHERGRIFAAHEEGEAVAMIAYGDLPWDSKLYGRSMGALKHVAYLPSLKDPGRALGPLLRHVCDWAASFGTEFLLCKSYANDVALIRALEKQGFSLVDTLLDYVYDIRRHRLA